MTRSQRPAAYVQRYPRRDAHRTPWRGVLALLLLGAWPGLQQSPVRAAPAIQRAASPARQGPEDIANPVLKTAPVGENPSAVAVDERTGAVFVALVGPRAGENQTPVGPGKLVVLNGQTGAVVHTTAVGTAPDRIVIDAAAGTAFVADGDDLRMLDAASGAPLRTLLPGTHVTGAALDPSRHLLYLATTAAAPFPGAVSSQPGQLVGLDSRTGAVRFRAPVGYNPIAVAFDARTGAVLVADAGYYLDQFQSCPIHDCHGDLRIYSGVGALRHDTVLHVPGDEQPGSSVNYYVAHADSMALDAAHGRVVVVASAGDRSDGLAWILDAATGSVLHTTWLGYDPGPVAVDPRSGEAFAINGVYYLDAGSLSTVSVLDLVSGKQVAEATVGLGAGALAVDGATDRVFVANSGYGSPGAGSISVLDAASNSVVATIPDQGGPTAFAVDAARGRVYAINGGGSLSGTAPGSLTVLDASVGYTPGSVRVDRDPEAVTVDPALRRAFVLTGSTAPSDAAPAVVQVLDSGTGRVVRSVAAGVDPQSLTVNSTLGRVYVVSAGSQGGSGAEPVPAQLSILDAASGAVLATVPLNNPGPLAVDGITGRIFLVVLRDLAPPLPPGAPPLPGSRSQPPNQVLILDARTGARLGATSIAGLPGSILVDERAGRVYVANRICLGACPDGIMVLDARTGAQVGAIAVPGGGQTLALDQRTGLLISAGAGAAQAGQPSIDIRIIDPTGGVIAHTVSLTGILGPLAVDSARGHVLVITTPYTPSAQPEQPILSLIDEVQGRVLRTIALPPNPRAIAVDQRAGGHIFVVNGDDTLSVLDGATGAVLRVTPVGVGASAIAVDDQAGRVFVVNAQSATVSVLDAGGVPLALGPPVSPPPVAQPSSPAPETDLPALDTDSIHATRTITGLIRLRIYNAPLGMADHHGWQLRDTRLQLSPDGTTATAPGLPFGLRIRASYTVPATATLTTEHGASLGVSLASIGGLAPQPADSTVIGSALLITTDLTGTAEPAATTPITATGPGLAFQSSYLATPAGMDLRLSLTPQQAAAPIVIALRPGAGTALAIAPGNAVVARRRCAVPACSSAGSELAFRIGPPFARTGAPVPMTGPGTGIPEMLGTTSPVRLYLAPFQGGVQLLTVQIDPAWLAAPTHRGMVTLDLPFQTGAAFAQEGVAGTVTSCDPGGMAAQGQLLVGSQSDCSYHGLLSFALPAYLPGTLRAATLHLYTPEQAGPGAIQVTPNAATPPLRPAQPPTWSLAPDAAAAPRAQSASDGYRQQWDVTDIVARWLRDPASNNGLTLASSDAPVLVSAPLDPGSDPLQAPYLELLVAPGTGAAQAR